MKNNLFCFTILVMIMTVGCQTKKIINSFIEVHPENIKKQDSSIPGSLHVALFRIDTIQNVSDKGLQFSVSITNNSNVNSTILNPLDFLTIGLMDSSGVNVAFPQYFRMENSPIVYNKFSILGVKKNGKSSSLSFESEKKITILAAEKLEIAIGVINILKPNTPKPYTIENSTMKIMKGKYVLLGVLSIIEGEKENMLYLKPVTINYGY